MAVMKMWQAVDSIPVLNCDLDIKQAAAVTLKLTQALQGVAWVSNLGQTAAVNDSEFVFLLWKVSAGWD